MNIATGWGRFAAGAAWLVLAGAASAQGIDLGITVGAYHTDNVRRTDIDEESQTVGELGLRLGIARDAGRFTSHVNANLAYRKFFDDAYDDDLFGGLDARLAYWFLPERFSWVVEENYGQALIEPRNVDTPGNQQGANYFSTGPDLVVPFGARTNLLVSGRWSDAAYEETEADNQRMTGRIGLERQMSERSTLSLNGTAERVEFDNELRGSNFDRQSAYVGYATEGARTTLSLEAGYTTLHDFGDTTGGPLLDLTIERQLSPRSTLTLNAGTNLTDSAEAMRRDQRIIGIDIDAGQSIVSTDSFQSDFASLALDLEGVRTSVSLGVNWRKESYERTDALDRDASGITALVLRRVSPRLSARLYGGWTTQDFDNSDVSFDEWNAGLGLDWAFSERIGVTLAGDHFSGSGDTAFGFGTRDYTENRVTVRLTYTPRRR
ncbi:MAG: hypothetical protein AB7G76_03675 [Steroidobacteraceae bacterium]